MIEYIDPVFQPIALGKSLGVYALEALLRFRGGESNAAPSSLIRIWEKSGFIAVIDIAMILKVASELKCYPKKYRISVNVSVRTIEDASKECIEALSKLGEVALKVIVEITETYPVTNKSAVSRFASSCRDRGLLIALDDCSPGRQFISREYIRLFKPNFMKMDGPFLSDCFSCDSKRDDFRRLVDLANAAKSIVMAEHVDSKAKLDFVHGVGVRLTQGFFIGKPVKISMVQYPHCHES